MLRAAILLVLGCLPAAAQDGTNALAELPIAGARDVTGEGRAFVETVTDRDTFFIQEPIHVRLRFGLERPFLEKEAVQLFQQTLDVPVQLQAAWLQNLPGTLPHTGAAPVPQDPSRSRRLSFALDDHVAEAVRLENKTTNGNTFTVLEIDATWLPTAVGDLRIPSPVLRFAYATSFQDDWTGKHVATDRRDAFVRGPSIVLHIEPLPEKGRPAGFSGAVGRFTVEADASPRELDVGQSLKLVLRIAGTGNLELFEAPRLEALDGFKLMGQLDATAVGVRTVTYDLAAQDNSVRAVSSIALSYFDPEPPAGYKTALTRSIPLEVHGASKSAPASDEAGGATTGLWTGGLVLASLTILVVWTMRRRPKDPRPARVYDAALAFTRKVEEPEADLAQALLEFLAVMLDCTVPAVVGPRLADRLVAAGVPTDLATRTAALLDRLMAARAAGKPPVEGVKGVRDVVDALERAIQPVEITSSTPTA